MTIQLVEKGNLLAYQALDTGDTIPSFFEVNIFDSDAWSGRPAYSPFIDTVGNRMRAPGNDAKFMLDEPITAGSGWHCIHVTNPVEVGPYSHVSIGIEAEALAVVDLTSSTDRLMVIGDEGFFNSAVVLDFPVTDYVIAIDYRGSSPIVHLITGGVVRSSSTFVTTSDIQIVVKIAWQSIKDWVYVVNMGHNLANVPMPAGIEAALTTAAVDTTGFVLGVNGSNPGSLVTPASVVVSGEPVSPLVGALVTLTGACTDAISVDRSSELLWYNDGENSYNAQSAAVGASYSYTIPQLGRYPIRCEYQDPQGRIIQDTAVIFADGSVTQETETQWSSSRSHPNIDAILGNQVRFGTEVPFKLAAIANQAMWGEFKYFELTLLTDDTTSQFGFGLTTLLNSNVMWAGPSAGSLATTDGAGSFSVVNQAPAGLGSSLAVWNNGSPFAAMDDNIGYVAGATEPRFGHGHTIGFAVDYRDKTALPLVYVIAADHSDGVGRSFGSFRMRQTRSPVVPVCYANISSNETVDYDVQINGGASAFQFDASTILSANGVDVTALLEYWSDNDPP